MEDFEMDDLHYPDGYLRPKFIIQTVKFILPNGEEIFVDILSMSEEFVSLENQHLHTALLP